MKTKLLEHFKERIVIAEIDGKADVVTFTKTVHMLLHEFHKSPRKSDPQKEKLRLIQTAGKLIRTDLKQIPKKRKVLSKHR